ncbi:pyruvate decarboxylase [Trichoderma arundinaceum]|uniref:Pyruvate decarboxylase n=1 Tax=Trichoderma arundinaceum TaxID=490622 RepID=A0A395N8S6_TRIAR|nr:pyruvate decarboxylase [Trichoderma arundinaceum]
MSEILVGQYLLRRLSELGVGTVFGVPGDYELALLNLIPEEGLSWVGTPNELVGAYAVDGYARTKRTPGALITTFGPGELSALCGIAGSYTEFVPVVHIVGYPKSAVQASGKIVHHTLGDLNYRHYLKMSDEISCATTVLTDASTAAAEIDRVLNAMLYHSQPVYIGVSEDIAYSKISAAGLETPLAKALPKNDLEVEDKVIGEILATLEESKNPVIIIDGGEARTSWEHNGTALINALRVPFVTTVLGKGIVNEQDELYRGCYSGYASWEAAVKTVDASDCVLRLGNFPADLNTGMFSEHLKSSKVIEFHRFSVKIGNATYDVKMDHVLPRLVDSIQKHGPFLTHEAPKEFAGLEPVPMPKIIGQDWLWNRMSSYLQPGDLVLTETGTTQFGFQQTRMPANSRNFTQGVWGSIGYASGSAVGASIAAKELGNYKRLVLITGEGSLQLTVQALSLLNRHGIPPVVFVLNNAGYTVERYFEGWDAEYNDVPLWEYGSLFTSLSPNVKTKTFKVDTAEALDKLLSDEEFQNASFPQCVDMIMDDKDAPTTMKALFWNKAN